MLRNDQIRMQRGRRQRILRTGRLNALWSHRQRELISLRETETPLLRPTPPRTKNRPRAI